MSIVARLDARTPYDYAVDFNREELRRLQHGLERGSSPKNMSRIQASFGSVRTDWGILIMCVHTNHTRPTSSNSLAIIRTFAACLIRLNTPSLS